MKNKILPTYGGQAVIEGVMMRGAKAVAIAMRTPDNEITFTQKNWVASIKVELRKSHF